MSIQLPLIPILFLLGAAHGLFLAFALFTQRSGSHRANVYLGLYTLLFVAALCDYFIDLSGLSVSMLWLRILLWPKEFLYGVLLYFYARELTKPGQFLLQGRQWLHFLPFFVHLAVTWPFLLLPGSRQHDIFYGGSGTGEPLPLWVSVMRDAESLLTSVHPAIYLLMSLYLLHQHRRRLLHAYSSLERVSLRWLSSLMIGTLVVYIVWLAEQFTRLGQQLDSWVDLMLGLSVVGLIYSMSLLGLRQVRIFASSRQAQSTPGEDTGLPPIDTVEAIDRDYQQKYRNSALSEELSGELMVAVDQAMQEDKLYQDPTLSLPQLAGHLNMPVNYLSQVINQQKGQNFFDYINSYRIAEVTRLMHETPDASILDIALASGFNSKSPFYTAFRKYTGMTPGQFRQQRLQATD